MRINDFLQQFNPTTKCEIYENNRVAYSGSVGNIKAGMIYAREIDSVAVKITEEGVLIIKPLLYKTHCLSLFHD